MTIDLSQFVDKEVIVKFRYGKTQEGVIKKCKTFLDHHPFYFPYREPTHTVFYYYTQSGCRYEPTGCDGHLDIVDIQLKPQKTMTKLSESTISKLADALAPEAVKYIQETEEYAEFMMNMFSEFITHQMGEMDEELKWEIQFLLMDRIYFVPHG